METRAFIGPTLAAAGIGMTLPIVSYNDRRRTLTEVSTRIRNTIDARGFFLDSKRAKYLRIIAWLFVIFLTAIWAYALYCSVNDFQISYYFKWLLLNIQVRFQYILGVACFFGGIAITEVKEIIDGNLTGLR